MALIDNSVLFETVEEKITDIRSMNMPSYVVDAFTKDLALRFCWSSNAIEGNTLSLDDTVALAEHDEVRSGHTFSEYRDAKNLYSAINSILIPFHQEQLSEKWVIEVNSAIMGERTGYRDDPVYIGNLVEAIYYPPAAGLVPGLMADFFADEGKRETIKAAIEGLALQHIKFERIHPFRDGNGRTGRMLLNQGLINNGLLPVAINPSGKYRQAFQRYGKNGDISLMSHQICTAELESAGRLMELLGKAERPLEGI